MTQGFAKISVSMIVKNEVSCLSECLKSVQGVDEIVIVDTGSTDGTQELARSYGAVVYEGPEFAWRDDYAFSRNQSLDRCTGDWVLIIDADETLESSISEVRAAIEGTEKDAIYFRTISKGSKRAEHSSIRLFKRIPSIFWERRIHNILSITDGQIPPQLVIEYGYSEAHKQDPDRSLRILSLVVQEEPGCIRERYYLAREYWYRKDYAQAIFHYEAYLKVGVWGPEIADARLMLARCYWALSRGDLAREACLRAVQTNANFKEALLFLADLSGPKNAVCWRRYAALATNEDVLFIR